jgi:hypothetical protein
MHLCRMRHYLFTVCRFSSARCSKAGGRAPCSALRVLPMPRCSTSYVQHTLLCLYHHRWLQKANAVALKDRLSPSSRVLLLSISVRHSVYTSAAPCFTQPDMQACLYLERIKTSVRLMCASHGKVGRWEGCDSLPAGQSFALPRGCREHRLAGISY